MHTFAVAAVVLGLCSGLVHAQPATRPAATPPATTRPASTVTKDVVYGEVGGVKLRLDASVPAGSGPFPAVVLVHGGAWKYGDKNNFVSLFDPLTHAGYAWFSINYRLAPKHPFPACADDVETAMKWVKQHAKDYNIDPDRVALLGESAGGHLVELVAARSDKDSAARPAAVVAMYAPSDLPALAVSAEAHGMVIGPILAAVFGRDTLDEKTQQLLRDASPLTYVKAGLPPFLLLHGTADQLVPMSQSTAFQTACRAVGVPCDLVTVKGGPHGMVMWNLIDPSYKAKIVDFLDSKLKTPTAGAAKSGA